MSTFLLEAQKSNLTGPIALDMFKIMRTDSLRELYTLEELSKLRDKYQNTALIAAIVQKRTVMVDSLLKYKSGINAANQSGYTALHFAVLQTDTALMIRLLVSGANVNARTKQHKTALMMCIKNDFLSGFELLLDAGAELSFADRFGRNVYQQAQHVKAYKIFELLSALHFDPFLMLEKRQYELLFTHITRNPEALYEVNTEGETLESLLCRDQIVATPTKTDICALPETPQAIVRVDTMRKQQHFSALSELISDWPELKPIAWNIAGVRRRSVFMVSQYKAKLMPIEERNNTEDSSTCFESLSYSWFIAQ